MLVTDVRYLTFKIPVNVVVYHSSTVINKNGYVIPEGGNIGREGIGFYLYCMERNNNKVWASRLQLI